MEAPKSAETIDEILAEAAAMPIKNLEEAKAVENRLVGIFRGVSYTAAQEECLDKIWKAARIVIDAANTQTRALEQANAEAWAREKAHRAKKSKKPVTPPSQPEPSESNQKPEPKKRVPREKPAPTPRSIGAFARLPDNIREEVYRIFDETNLDDAAGAKESLDQRVEAWMQPVIQGFLKGHLRFSQAWDCSREIKGISRELRDSFLRQLEKLPDPASSKSGAAEEEKSRAPKPSPADPLKAPSTPPPRQHQPSKPQPRPQQILRPNRWLSKIAEMKIEKAEGFDSMNDYVRQEILRKFADKPTDPDCTEGMYERWIKHWIEPLIAAVKRGTVSFETGFDFIASSGIPARLAVALQEQLER